MSRASDIMSRIELVAKKLEMTIEDALSILEGKHATKTIVAKTVVATTVPPAGASLATVAATAQANAAAVNQGDTVKTS